MIINDPRGKETGNVSQPQLGTCSLPALAVHTRPDHGVSTDVISFLLGLRRSPCPPTSHLPFLSGVEDRRAQSFLSHIFVFTTFSNLIHLHLLPCPTQTRLL